MTVTLDKIKKAALIRYQLTIDDDQALQIKYKIFENSQVQDVLYKIKKLPQNFVYSGLHASGMLAILLGFITILLALYNQTSQFPNYLKYILQGLVLGQFSIYSYFYIYFYSKLNRITKKLMFVNLASLHHTLRLLRL